MSDIYVFSGNEDANDYSTMGLVCALTPTECKFEETANGESLLTLNHPIDEYGRYKALVSGNILVAPVPVRTTPEIQNGGTLVTTVWTYKVKPLDQLTSKSQRTLYKNKTGSGQMKLMNAGDELTIVEKPADEGQGSSSNNQRWKAKTPYGTGWINSQEPMGIEPIGEDGGVHILPNKASAIEDVQSPWTVMPQYFRIYETKKSLTEVSVSARHISYDLLYTLTNYKSEESVPLTTALKYVLANTMTEHPFSGYTNIINERAGLRFDNTNPIDAIMNAEKGLCKLYGVSLIRDNYSIYLLDDPGLNRGVHIRYAKNMTGVECTISEDEVVTRIMPIGETKDGDKLYLDDVVGSIATSIKKNYHGPDVRSMQRLLRSLSYITREDQVTGKFDSTTESALKRYQRDHTMTQDGICTPEIYATMLADSGLSANNRFVDSSHINSYPVVHMYELKCDHCKVGEKDEGGGKVTVEIARARMRAAAQKKFDEPEECDKPKVEMSVEFVSLGDTEEYKDYKNLENCFLFDYVQVQHPTLGIDMTARIVKIEWNCLLDRMESCEIGEVGKTLATSGITAAQIPNGVSGSKIENGTISTAALGDDAVTTRNIQAESINAELVNADSVVARLIEAVTAKIRNLEADEANIKTLYAQMAHLTVVEIAKAEIDQASIMDAVVQDLKAKLATIVTANLTNANIENANIDWATIENLTAATADIADAEIASADINYAKIKTADTEQLITKDAVAERYFIDRLQVNNAQLVNATVGNLIVKGKDGRYYRLVVSTDDTQTPPSVSVHYEQVTNLSAGEISAGVTGDGKSVIVETDLTAENLSATNMKAINALIDRLTASRIDVGELFARQATINAINTMDIRSNSYLRLFVSGAVDSISVGGRNYIQSGKTMFLEGTHGLVDRDVTSVVGSAIVGQAVVV